MTNFMLGFQKNIFKPLNDAKLSEHGLRESSGSDQLVLAPETKIMLSTAIMDSRHSRLSGPAV